MLRSSPEVVAVHPFCKHPTRSMTETYLWEAESQCIGLHKQAQLVRTQVAMRKLEQAWIARIYMHLRSIAHFHISQNTHSSQLSNSSLEKKGTRFYRTLREALTGGSAPPTQPHHKQKLNFRTLQNPQAACHLDVEGSWNNNKKEIGHEHRV